MARLRPLVKVLAINTGFSFLPPILLLAMSSEHVPFARLRTTFLFSLVYSHSIGSLCFATVPKVWEAVEGSRAWWRWFSRIAVVFVDTVIGSLVACGILIAIGWLPREFYWPEFWGSLKIALLLSIVAGLTIGIYETYQGRLRDSELQLKTKELERERALKLATEAQLASLESRIHPHFLFNTLNSISSLIPEDPKRAERLVEQMAALLRFSLDANQAGLVPLAAELKVVADYLDIERARFGDRLHYQIDLAADLAGARVPALAVQTLVENSIKHAIAANRSGGEIRIAGSRENGCLRVAVIDAGPGFTLESAPAGHGLDNLKDRLTTLFGERAALKLDRRENKNCMVLTVPYSD
ncbi:MAG TPA: histidine kinase [Bryobacteraceae bacterium]|nr:histidine kinase [Bryobacteraceae bacterium]